MIEPSHPHLSIRKQCELLGLNRSNYYYQVQPAYTEEELAIMNLIDEEYTRHPFYGTRRMKKYIKQQGYRINRKRVQRYYRVMGLEAIGPKPNLSRRHPEHKVYPYLLSNLTLTRSNQVWSTDITYIRLKHGFIYLAAIIDWHSRYVLHWAVSTTLASDFCVELLKETIERYGTPEIFNSDQGSQFTATAFIDVLKHHAIRISMDGKGRALDNVFIERLWRSVKYECVYPMVLENLPAAKQALSDYFRFYNQERFHQSLDYATPEEIYYRGLKQAA